MVGNYNIQLTVIIIIIILILIIIIIIIMKTFCIYVCSCELMYFNVLYDVYF